MLRALSFMTIALLLALASARAQVAPHPLTAEDTLRSIGKPIVSSDGVALGRIEGIGANSGAIVFVAELERPLGIGVQVVVLAPIVVARVTDRVELSVTSEEIWARMKEIDDTGADGGQLL